MGRSGDTPCRFRRLAALLSLALLLVLSPVFGSGTSQTSAAKPKDRDRITPQIVGGTPVSDGEYPFVAAILDVSLGRTAFQRQFCGGSLIDASYVLTAAHCVSHPKPRRKDLRVLVGRTVLSSSQGVSRRVAKIIVHPQYNPAVSDSYDAALLQLSVPVTEFTPVGLPSIGDSSFEQAGQATIVAGWGSMTQRFANGGGGQAVFPDRMEEVTVFVVSDSTCADDYDSSGTFINGAVMVCAGAAGKDSCQGDSGGPLFVADGGGYRQIGIVSFGIGCADPNFPGVYSQVSSNSIGTFIQNTIP